MYVITSLKGKLINLGTHSNFKFLISVQGGVSDCNENGWCYVAEEACEDNESDYAEEIYDLADGGLYRSFEACGSTHDSKLLHYRLQYHYSKYRNLRF